MNEWVKAATKQSESDACEGPEGIQGLLRDESERRANDESNDDIGIKTREVGGSNGRRARRRGTWPRAHPAVVAAVPAE